MTFGTAADASAGFDWGLFWAIVAAVVGTLALIGVGFQIVGYYRDHPKRRIEWSATARRLLPADLRPHEFEVSFRGVEIRDPYIVELRVRSNSRADIPSPSFDAGKPITFQIGQRDPIVFLDDSEARGIRIVPSFETRNGTNDVSMLIEPQLIRRRASATMSFVASGLPDIKLGEWPLVDVDVKAADTAGVARRSGRFLREVLLGAAVAATGGVIVAYITSAFLS
ncbi:hypothetical protein B1729_03570 [Microbacterium sp. B35-04]|uniref:hypothetical protein n=1 Tax=Microbacterium sp. B35-04 TaxID=1961716 RepID=UPI0013D248C4|nr:hypothetical protein [Microbacterium sp. B35-04]KAF2414671.1 hypothetical protein B1729_03570 [Microbacterium sp. B35-04]